MNISGKCDYACRAMLELAKKHHTGTPVSSQFIADQQSIPEKYLTHILLQLKRSGLIRSIRGAQGGYELERQPNEISLLNIVEAIDGPIIVPAHSSGFNRQHGIFPWKNIAERISELFADYTLEKMLEMTSRADMFHI